MYCKQATVLVPSKTCSSPRQPDQVLLVSFMDELFGTSIFFSLRIMLHFRMAHSHVVSKLQLFYSNISKLLQIVFGIYDLLEVPVRNNKKNLENEYSIKKLKFHVDLRKGAILTMNNRAKQN